MNRPRPWAALFAVLFATALLCGGCKDFFHPEGPTKTPEPYPLTDEQAANAFREIETVREALEINVAAIGLDVPAEDLAALETKVDQALADYDQLSQGTRSALAAEKAKLDTIKEKIGHVNSALDFQKEHEAALAKSPEELESPEEAAGLLPELKEALKAIEALSEGAQELLEDDIALLEDLKAKAEELTAPPPPQAAPITIHLETVPDDPALAEQSVPVTEGDNTTTFNAAGGYTSHAWYWDGDLQSGQTGPAYTLTGEEAAGIHELFVVVSGEGGKPLSARCKVTIKAKAN
jgi:hypothetical protein